MLNVDDIKRRVKSAENWQVEFQLAKGSVPDMFWALCSTFANADDGGDLSSSVINAGESFGMWPSDCFAHWLEAGCAQPIVYDSLAATCRIFMTARTFVN